MRRIVAAFIMKVFSYLSLKTSLAFVSWLLCAQGIGSGGRDIYKSGEVGVLRRLFKNKKGDITVFDVGANVGDYTQAIISFSNQCNVFAFEPSKKTFQELENNIKALANSSNAISLFNHALGEVEETRSLFSNKDLSGLASMTKRRLDHFDINMQQEETIRTRKLDDVISENGIHFIDLLKIDVEGHELEVLKGGELAFKNGLIGAVQFEFGGCNIDTKTFFQDFHYFFKKYNFEIYLVHSRGLSKINNYQEILENFITTNFVAVAPAGKAEVDLTP